MKLNRIAVRGDKLSRASAKDLAKMEAELWVKLPSEYCDYVTTLGEGVLGGTFIRVYPPWRVLKEIADWRNRIRRYWFWDKGRKLLPKERALESIILADTLQGDELVFHPMRPDRFFVLPRYRETVFEVQADFLETIEWMCTSGKLTRPFKERVFEPFDSRKQVVPPIGEADSTDNTLADAVESLQKWAKSHSATDTAVQRCKEWIEETKNEFYGVSHKRIKKDKVAINFQDHALVFQPGKHRQPEVVSTLQLSDSKTGFDFGLFRSMTEVEGGESYSLELHAGKPEAYSHFLKKET
jgi:hypothetical protein